MELRIYGYQDGGFVPYPFTNRAYNVRYTVHAYEPSAFSFDFPLLEKDSAELKSGRFVLTDDFIGVITRLERIVDANGSTVKVSGIDMKGITGRRIIIPRGFSGIQGTAGYDAVQGYTDACIKHYWRNNIASDAEANRRIPYLTIAPDRGVGIADDKYMARFDCLSDVVSELASAADVVVTATPDIDGGTILLDVCAPVIRTAEQDAVPQLILSTDRKTVLSIQHTSDDGSYRNAFYATRSGSQFADEALTMLYMRDGESEPSGGSRYEQHLNVSADTPVAGQEYSEMRRQAVHGMLNYQAVNMLTAKANFTNMQYKRDYEVGDFVTVQFGGISVDAKITAVEVSAGTDGRTENITLGTEEKGVISKILTQVRNI